MPYPTTATGTERRAKHGQKDHARFAFIEADCCPKTILANFSQKIERKRIILNYTTINPNHLPPFIPTACSKLPQDPNWLHSSSNSMDGRVVHWSEWFDGGGITRQDGLLWWRNSCQAGLINSIHNDTNFWNLCEINLLSRLNNSAITCCLSLFYHHTIIYCLFYQHIHSTTRLLEQEPLRIMHSFIWLIDVG